MSTDASPPQPSTSPPSSASPAPSSPLTSIHVPTAHALTPLEKDKSNREALRETLNKGMGGLMDVLVERICTLEAMMLEAKEVREGGGWAGG
jgi:hypothetical protein